MIENWLKKDIERTYNRGRNRFVLIDPHRDFYFLLDTLPDSWVRIEAHTDTDEIKAKSEAEKKYSEKNVLFYTTIQREKLKFLREYCETNGYLELTNAHNYIKEKVHEHTGLNLNLSKEELLTAAQAGIGQLKSYWIDLCHRGSDVIFDLQKMLLPFLHNPVEYAHQFHPQVRKAFLEKVQKYIGQTPIEKEETIIAREVIEFIFDGLLTSNIDQVFIDILRQWLDSHTYSDSLTNYKSNYHTPENIDIWSVNISHPFPEIDLRQLRAVCDKMYSEEINESWKKYIINRSNDRIAMMIGVSWWADVLTILNFDHPELSLLNNISELSDYYVKNIYHLDRAIRHLYTKFLNHKEIIKPLQEKYESLLKEFFDKWFAYFESYQGQQQGYLEKIINEKDDKIAIIVCDGLTYEIALCVSDSVDKSVKTKPGYIIAEIPSTTENNMSNLFGMGSEITSVKSRREEYLKNSMPEINIGFVELDEVNQTHSEYDVLICSHRDIDDIGEKMQQGALKYFENLINLLSEKITDLKRIGYKTVHLVTDHGFVLIGSMDESDKVTIDLKGKGKIYERYVLTDLPQKADHLLEVKKKYKEYNYIYFSKNMRSFKSPGEYGYSHGGITPQEIVIPHFVFHAKESIKGLPVYIINKAELQEIVGENYEVKIQAESGAGDIFSSSRRCQLYFYRKGELLKNSDVFEIERGGGILKREYSFEVATDIDIILLDAKTKEQLDKAKVKKSSARDMGGLKTFL